MSDSPDTKLREALSDLRDAMTGLRCPAMIIGGLAVIARGIPRLTTDIDTTVWGSDITLDRLLDELELHRIVLRIPEGRELARRRQVLLLLHRPTGTPLEVSIAWLPFEEEAIRRATLVDLGGVVVPVAQAEDLIALRSARDSNDRQGLEAHHPTP